MKYLFLSILMIGVGIGVVGCEDDDKDNSPEVVEDVQPRQQPPKWEPDISGLWEHAVITTDTNGAQSAGISDLRIRQSGENIIVEHVSFSNPTSQPYSVRNGYVTKEYTVMWDDYSGIINDDASRMWGTNIFTWGASVWNAVKLP